MIKIFVVGCPRSGTTLIQELLGMHPDIYTCKETHFFRKIRRKGKRKLLDYLVLSPRNVLQAYEFIRSHNKLLGQYDSGSVRSLRAATLFFNRLMTSEAQARDKLAWVEKTPGHLFNIGLIKRHIPAAQFVHVIRDGRDVVASLVDAAERFPRVWQKYADLNAAIDLYNSSLAESLKYSNSKDHIFVQYEHVLEDSESLRQQLYRALGLGAAVGNLPLNKIHQKVIRSDEGWKDNHQGAIGDTRLIKFERIFNARQKKLVADLIQTPSPELLELCI